MGVGVRACHARTTHTIHTHQTPYKTPTQPHTHTHTTHTYTQDAHTHTHTEAHAAGGEGRGVLGDRVLVEGDAGKVAQLLKLGAGEVLRAEVPKNAVVVRALSHKSVPVLLEAVGELCVCEYASE